jgi:membrane-associated protein
VPSLERLADALTAALTRTGPWAPAILFFASFIEYVFPPFPGDMLVVLGAWYAHAGVLSWTATFAAVTAGAIAGAWVDYRMGVALGRRIDRRAARTGSLSEERLARFEASYRRWGGWLLVANRFFPGIRAFFFLAAGASGIPLPRVLLLGGVSAALWNALLLTVGALVARNVGDLVAIFERYTTAAWIAVVAVGIALPVAWLWRRRAQRAAPEGR